MLYHEVAGDGRPVVLLHAGFADSSMWDAQWTSYAHHFQTVRLDLPGFGRSPITSLPVRYAEATARLFDELNIRDAAMVGCSLGGRVALELAIARPDLVRSLVLAGAATPRALAVAPEMAAYATELTSALTRGDVEAAVEVSVHTWVDGPHRRPEDVDADVRAKVAAMQRRAFALTRDFARDWREELLVEDLVGRLDEIQSPALVLVGALDMDFIRREAELLAARIHHAQLATIPDTAHATNVERPHAFDASALPFLLGHQ